MTEKMEDGIVGTMDVVLIFSPGESEKEKREKGEERRLKTEPTNGRGRWSGPKLICDGCFVAVDVNRLALLCFPFWAAMHLSHGCLTTIGTNHSAAPNPLVVTLLTSLATGVIHFERNAAGCSL